MATHYTSIHKQFKLNGICHTKSTLLEFAHNVIENGEPYQKQIGQFLFDWFDANDFVLVQTSGSTGKPKQIKLKKQGLVNSALATGKFFNLQPGHTALHCLPTQYIAGKMMLVRALILGLELDTVAPTLAIKFNYKIHYDFCAMVPLQLSKTLANTKNIKTIIIGGAKSSQALLNAIKNSTTSFYETYGMTETITHIAIKQLASKHKNASLYFEALPNVRFSKDIRQCLVISAPHILDSPVITNDLVELVSDTCFKLLGRLDNVINSGGVKLFPEQIEEKLQVIIKQRFIIASETDIALGEKLILIIESDSVLDEDVIRSEIQNLKTITKLEVPKKIYAVKQFSETSNGKIKRSNIIKSVLG